jgi:hypothetical protein
MSRRTQRPFGSMQTPETFQAGSEFTDRDPQFPATREYNNSASEATSEQALPNTPLGEPPVDVDVRSVYDVRPIGAFDVNLPLTSADSLRHIDEDVNLSVTVVQAVPLGYVFVLRKLSTYFSGNIPPIVFRSDALVTLMRNQGDVQFNTNIPIGVEQTDLDLFIIYDEGEQFGARVNLSAITVDFPASFLGCVFYGNFLRKTGRPAPQEIGNPVKVPRRSVDR